MVFRQWLRDNEDEIDTYNDPVEAMEKAFNAGSLEALERAYGAKNMDSAPKDGTEIYILFRHSNFKYANENDQHEWQQWCKAYWTDFNNGGWVWHGICGVPIVWHPS